MTPNLKRPQMTGNLFLAVLALKMASNAPELPSVNGRNLKD
jgi:hypothetical protein